MIFNIQSINDGNYRQTFSKCRKRIKALPTCAVVTICDGVTAFSRCIFAMASPVTIIALPVLVVGFYFLSNYR